MKMETRASNKYNLTGLISLIKSTESLTQQALAIEYARIRWAVFPCDENKAPIVDQSLGFTHGHRGATTDLKLIARTWHKYPNAGIGLAIPEDLIVIDCDVKKDAEKKPILKDGMPDIIGLRSLQYLILNLDFKEADLDTLSVKTQSGGRHFFYQMPSGVPSFCHTGALTGLDLKGFGGYVVLPRSQGQHGHYDFLNLVGIHPVPEGLLKWVLQFREHRGEFKKISINYSGSHAIEVEKVVFALQDIWGKAPSGHSYRANMAMALSGYLLRKNVPAEDVKFIISELGKRTGHADHSRVVDYTLNKLLNGSERVTGATTLGEIIKEVESCLK